MILFIIIFKWYLEHLIVDRVIAERRSKRSYYINQIKEKVLLDFYDWWHRTYTRAHIIFSFGEKENIIGFYGDLFREEVLITIFRLLNINFEFRHTIEDHSFRITQDKLEFECYVDNESFQSLMHRGVFDENKKKKTSKIE